MRLLRTFLVLSIGLIVFLVIGCGGQEKQEAAQTETETSSVGMDMVEHTPSGDEVGMMVKSPVSGMEFTVTDTTKAVIYKEHTYYFMNQDEKSKFMENPDQFMMGMAADTMESMAAPDTMGGE